MSPGDWRRLAELVDAAWNEPQPGDRMPILARLLHEEAEKQERATAEESAMRARVEESLEKTMELARKEGVGCEKCAPGCGQTWFRCPACDTLHRDLPKVKP